MHVAAKLTLGVGSGMLLIGILLVGLGARAVVQSRIFLLKRMRSGMGVLVSTSTRTHQNGDC